MGMGRIAMGVSGQRTPEESFARLRVLLSCRPSRWLFASLLQLFWDWSDDDSRAIGLEYASLHLASWPDSLRSAELWSVWPHFPRGEPKPHAVLVRRLAIQTQWLEGTLGRILEHPKLSDICELSMESHWDGEAFRGWFQTPALSRIRSLSWKGTKFDNAELAALVSWEPLANLQELQLHCFRTLTSGIQALIEAAFWTNLESLSLSSCGLEDEELQLFASLPSASALRSLDLSFNWFGEESFAALAGARWFSQLESLSVNGMVEESYEVMASLSQSNLRFLELRGWDCREEVLRRVVRADCFRELTHLRWERGACHALALEGLPSKLKVLALTSEEANNLSGSAFVHYERRSEKGFQALVRGGHLHSLQELEVDRVGLGLESMRALAEADLGALRGLRLASCQLTDAEVKMLASASWLRSLVHLDFDGNEVQEEGCAALFVGAEPWALESLRLERAGLHVRGAEALASSSFPRLCELVLDESAIGDKGLALLVDAPWFGELEHLECLYTGVTRRGLEVLGEARMSFPSLQLSIGEDVSAGGLEDGDFLEFARVPWLGNLILFCIDNEPTWSGSRVFGMLPGLSVFSRKIFLDALSDEEILEEAKNWGIAEREELNRGELIAALLDLGSAG